ncbi:MAG: hypothetical protein FJ125_18505, partial [Deltaproteobacteria bacterium]|nr:hypothetical protein [Deltaproteobacteria bacterium]
MLRLTSFAARGFRSLAEVELADLPRVVLLYGENNVGKSNLIQAVDLWFRLLRAAAGVWPLPLPGHEPEMRLCEEARLELEALERPELLFGQEPGRLPRDGQSSFELEGTLRVAEEHDFVFGFRTSVIAGEPWPRVELLRALAPGPARIGSPLASTDLRLLGLRQELAHGWLRLEAARRFWPERLAQQRENGEAALAGDGSNVKRQLFSAAHGVQTAPRRLVEESFVPLVRRALPGLAPPLSLHDEEFVHLYLGERRVEDCGSGVQQWVLLTALLALSRAAVIGIEEPEDHLSWSMQKTVAEALAAVIHDPGRPPYQLIASTHSELMEGMSLDGSWYRVTLEQG